MTIDITSYLLFHDRDQAGEFYFIFFKRKHPKYINMTVIGIVGFGSLGQAIFDYATQEEHLEVGWVWNRNNGFQYSLF